jgi:hypothetical protein
MQDQILKDPSSQDSAIAVICLEHLMDDLRQAAMESHRDATVRNPTMEIGNQLADHRSPIDEEGALDSILIQGERINDCIRKVAEGLQSHRHLPLELRLDILQ